MVLNNLKSLLIFTVIATTTIFKIPLIIVALVVIIFRNPGTLRSPWRFLKLTKLSSLMVVQSWRDVIQCQKGLTIVEFVVKSNFHRTCRYWLRHKQKQGNFELPLNSSQVLRFPHLISADNSCLYTFVRARHRKLLTFIKMTLKYI